MASHKLWFYSHHTFQSRCTLSHSSPPRDDIEFRHAPFCGCLLASAHGCQGYPEDLITFLPARRGKGNGGLCEIFWLRGLKLMHIQWCAEASLYRLMDCKWGWYQHAFYPQLLTELSELEEKVGNWRISSDQNTYSLPGLHCLVPPPHGGPRSCLDILCIKLSWDIYFSIIHSV